MELLHWADGIQCAVTICDEAGKILYMNDMSRETFARHGDIIGHDLYSYHPQRAQEQIRHMLATGETNAYTITKNGHKKIIYQTPWKKDGKIAGLVEISIPLPADMAHYDRDKQ
ncbi:MAG: PAS domain-containing protein [Bacteroidales bacterium]|nr:PAS domain-containing protein [Bacteroidales bacterium]